jgi:hypothetical protein
MATRSAALKQPPEKARSAQPARKAPEARPALGVVDRRHLLERARRRQAVALFVLAALCIAGPLLVSALANALVATDQVRSDSLQTQIASALQTQQELQLKRAQLMSSPDIFSVAETHLHMVFPRTVTYLPAVNPGESVAQAHQPGSTALAGSGAAGSKAGKAGNFGSRSKSP